MHDYNLISSTPVFEADGKAVDCVSRNVLHNKLSKIFFRFPGS